MGSVTGIYPKLKSTTLSWEEKFNLARTAWHSAACVIPNKQQVLLDWVCQELINAHRRNARETLTPEVVLGLWTYLEETLSSEELKQHSGIPLTLKPQFLQVFAEAFSQEHLKINSSDRSYEDRTLEVLINCCSVLTTIPELANILFSKFETFVPFLSSLLCLFVVPNLGCRSELSLLVETGLEKFLALQRRQANQKKVFSSTCQHLLQPFLSACYTLKITWRQNNPGLHSKAETNCNIIQMIHTALSNALFHRDHLSEFQLALKAIKDEGGEDNREPATKKPRYASYPKQLFDTLWGAVKSRKCDLVKIDVNVEEAVTDGLPFLYQAFVVSSRAHNQVSPAVEFDFFTELCDMLGVKDHLINEKDSAKTVKVLSFLHEMLQIVVKHDIYQATEDEANGSVQFNWFVKRTQLLIKIGSSPVAFNCLAVMLKLNHLILEPYLEDIWTLFWSSKEEMDRALETSKDSLMSSLQSTYFKLRQFDKFLMAMFSSLRNKSMAGCCHIPAQFLEGYIEVVKRVPFGQSTMIWQVFCDEIEQHYLQVAGKGSSSSSKKRRHLEAGVVKTESFGSFEHIVILFSVFFLNTSLGGVGDHYKTSATLERISQLYRRTVTDVLKPLIDVVPGLDNSNNKHSACFSALVLHYAVGEFTVFLEILKLFQESDCGDNLPEFKWSEALGCHVPADSWGKLTLLKKDRGRLRFLQDLLCVQMVRRLLSRSAVNQTEEREDDLSRAVSYLCRVPEEAEQSSDALWDGQLWSVDTDNYTVSHWDLLARHAVVLLPLCSPEQRLHLAHFLVTSLLSDPLQESVEKKRCLTVADVSLRLVHSAEFHENVLMQTSVVCALWLQVQRTLCHEGGEYDTKHASFKVLSVVASCKRAEDKQPMHDGNQFDDGSRESDDVSDSESDEEVSKEKPSSSRPSPKALEHFVSLGRNLNRIFEGAASQSEGYVLTLKCAKKIRRLMEVLGLLPHEWFTNENHVRTFLGLLSCQVLLQTHLTKEFSQELLQASSSCQHLLRLTLEGCVRSRRFLLHHVTNIAAFQTWLLSSVSEVWKQKAQVCMGGPGMCLERTVSNSVDSGKVRLVSNASELLCIAQRFLLRTSSRGSTPSDNLVNKVCENLQLFSSQIKQHGGHQLQSFLRSRRPELTVMTELLAVYEETIGNRTSRDRVLKTCVRHVLQLAPPFLELLQALFSQTKTTKRTKQERETASPHSWHDILRQTPLFTESFASLLQICQSALDSRKLSFAVGKLRELPWRILFPVVLADVVRFLQDTGQTKQGDIVEQDKREIVEEGTLKSCLHFLHVVCHSCSSLALDLPGNFHPRLLASLLHLLKLWNQKSIDSKNTSTKVRESNGLGSFSLDGGTFQHEREAVDSLRQQHSMEEHGMTEKARSVVICLFQGCDKELLPVLLQALCDELNLKHALPGSLPRLSTALSVWSLLLSDRFVKEKKTEVRPVLSTLLLSLQSLLQKLKNTAPTLSVATVDIMQKILYLGKGMVMPHYATLVLHGSLMMDLQSAMESFPAMFQSQASLLSTLLFQHSEAVYRTMHVFITCLKNLLHSLFLHCENTARDEDRESSEAAAKTGSVGEPVLLICAQKMARLYQEVATHKIPFSKYSPYMIAEYITGVQTVFLPAAVKETLIPGVYCLLDLCGEHEMAVLHAVLEKGTRELFRSLHEDYNKYHRFKGKV